MRVLLTGLLAALTCAALPQGTKGSYTSPGGTAQPWAINANHTLIWNGAPYLPLGLRIDGNPADIAKAKEAGFSDVIVELPAGGTGWDPALAALKAGSMRYLISINSLAPMAEGIAVDPAGYRVTGLTKPQKLAVRLPGAKNALVVVVNQRDSSVSKVHLLPVLDGVMSVDVKPIADLEQILLIYPRVRSLEQPDLWDALDEHRDRLLATLRSHPPGDGLRGILNPIGRVASWTKTDPHFVPTSPYFRIEFAAFLKKKYSSVQTAMQSWSMAASDIDSFERLARLAPLWSGPSRGIRQLWDTDSDKLYTMTSNRSQVWSDIEDCIAEASQRRHTRFVQAIRSITDVPVIQEWAGWMPLIEGAAPPVDGVGMPAFGFTPSEILNSASRAASSVLRWRKPGWLVATEIEPGAGEDAAQQLPNVLDDITSLGARGWFLRPGSDPVVKMMATQGQRTADAALAEYSATAVFFPENAFNPAMPQRLPGGRWWLPSPANGNRLDFGSHFFAYRYQEGMQNFIAMWTDLPPMRVKLKMLQPKMATFTSIDGTLVDPKFSKDGVQVTIGSIPIIIGGTNEIPIPDPAYAETLSRVNELFLAAETMMIDITEPRFLFRDALAGFDRNPGGSFFAMRTQYERLSLRLAPYTWVEAEATKTFNFSELAPSPSCSFGGMLSLKTQIASPAGGYFADYTVPVKSNEEVELWIAARIPREQRKNVSIELAGDTFTIQSEPLSPYGQGFAWYKLGTTRLAGRQTKMRLKVNSETADMAFDAFLLFPGSYQPKGVRIPDAIVFAAKKK